MIKFIHEHKQATRTIFIFIGLCFAVSGVGLGFMDDSRDSRAAIRVNDRDFTFQEVSEAERRLDEQYRNMFGDNYRAIAGSLNIPQQATDSLVNGYLIESEAKKAGFVIGDDEVRQFILTKMFDRGNGFSPDQYRAMLQSMGMSAPQFENAVRDDLIRAAFTGLLTDVAIVNDSEVKARMVRQETAYTFVAASYSAASVLGDVPQPADKDLERYYEENATDYELPARAAYEYIVLAPEAFKKDVQVLPEDIELYYSDNHGKFATPEQVHYRSIKLLYPKDPDPTKMSAVRDLANKAHEEAVAGSTPFDLLVAKYSDDIPSKATGGDRGWYTKGASPSAVEQAALTTQVGSISGVIETDYGFEIVKVEEKKPAGERPLDEVRSQIEDQIRLREAPAYAAAKAREIISQAKQGASLEELAKKDGLTFATTSGLLDASTNPSPDLTGLTARVLQLPVSDQSVPSELDLGDRTIIVKVTDFKEPTTASFQEVKEKVITAYKNREAHKLAQERATALLEKAKAQPDGDLKVLAAETKGTVEGPFSLSRANPVITDFKNATPTLHEAIFSSKPNTLLDQVFDTQDGFMVVKVTDVKKPDLTGKTEELEKYHTQAQQQLARTMVDSTLTQLKVGAKIDIDPSLLDR